MKPKLPSLPTLFLVCLALAAGSMAARPLIARHTANADLATMNRVFPGANIAANEAGSQHLLDIAARIEQRSSVTVRVRHRALVAGKSYFGVGTYRQQGRGNSRRTHWEMRSQDDGLDATLLQVSTGRYLYTDRALPSGRTVDRIDLGQVRRRLTAHQTSTAPVVPGQAAWAAIDPELGNLGGGLPAAIDALRESFEFSPPRAFRMGDSAVLASLGRWRPQVLAELLQLVPADAPQPSIEELRKRIATASFPERLPHHVLLIVSQRDWFPHTIEFRSASDPLSQANLASEALFQLSSHPLARIELFDVQFDSSIPATQFDYDPPKEIDFHDGTARVLERIDRRHRVELASGNGSAPR